MFDCNYVYVLSQWTGETAREKGEQKRREREGKREEKEKSHLNNERTMQLLLLA